MFIVGSLVYKTCMDLYIGYCFWAVSDMDQLLFISVVLNSCYEMKVGNYLDMFRLNAMEHWLCV